MMADGKRIKRIGILTGGGDCPGLNAVIRAVVKTAVLGYGMQVFGIEDGFAGMVQGRLRALDIEAVSGILPRGGTILGTTNRDNPFRYQMGEKNGQPVFADRSDEVAANMHKAEIDALVVVGGDGSLSIGRDLFQQKGISVIGVPKTIDNDLSATDVTFGFDTALNTATSALDKLHTTAESHHRVMVLEVMGRYAGWIALEAGLAGGADVILIPEIPYRLEAVCDAVRHRSERGKKFSIVVAAEGAHPAGGEMVVKKTVATSYDPVRLGGIGNLVGEGIERVTGMETRVTTLGHIQRGGSPTPFDRILATRYGVEAAHAAAAGKGGVMVALRGSKVETVTLDEAVRELRRVDPEGELARAALSVGISFGA